MPVSLGRLGSCWRDGSAYESDGREIKRQFHAAGVRRMRKLAQLIGLPDGTFDVRSNKGGIAVSGEVTLHGESIYVQASWSCVGGPIVLVRACRGRKDYSGGPNHTVKGWHCLDDFNAHRAQLQAIDSLDALAAYCQAISRELKPS